MKVKPKEVDKFEGMNKTEAEHARHLEHLRMEQVILDWMYEKVTLKIAENTRYTPDFMVVTETGIEFHEVKGAYVRDDAWVKYKVAKAAFPWFHWKLYQKKKKNEWIVK
tara:strand:- start:342 stop:668 length:327 start_codon:yes stop_codon:yes gene_type:complete